MATAARSCTVALLIEANVEHTAVALGDLELSAGDLSRLVADVEVQVDAYPSSGSSPFRHYYVVVLEELGLAHCDLGLDAALIGLTEEVGEKVRAVLADPSDERRRVLPLLLRLHLADLDGSLGRLLEHSTRLVRDGTILDRHCPG